MSRSIELLASLLLAVAVLHTFFSSYFSKISKKYPNGSLAENLFHFLSETEIVFGLWAAVLFLFIAIIQGSFADAVNYIESLNYTEPKFVLVIMLISATRPIVNLAENIINFLAKLLPFSESIAFYFVSLSFGTLLGSFITEPAAMTLLALLLKRKYFDRGISLKLAYATLGILFVNISIGGTLTHFAAPPVLMVAHKWNWDTWYMFSHFGWRAVLSCILSTVLISSIFYKELSAVKSEHNKQRVVPIWLTCIHLLFMTSVIYFAHHPEVFFGIFMIFLGVVTATKEYQDSLRFREALLVGFFLAGLVTLGSLQAYWLKPLIAGMSNSTLYFATTFLTGITDNAALTYLGSLVDGITLDQKYALVAGAVTGGGLTIIANAPNPAGVGILQYAKVFTGNGINPLYLFLGAALPTCTAIICFWFL